MKQAMKRGIVALCFAAAAGVASAAEQAAPEQAAPTQAIWKEQEIAFYLQTFTTFYSCSALETKLERILEALGAKDPKVRVRGANCPGVARSPRVIIQLSSPVEATPEAIAERDKNRSTRELKARVRGERAEGTEATEQFAAQWRKVSLSRGELSLEEGDCELIEQLQRNVLPKLRVRVIEGNVRCVPHDLTRGQPRLEVEALAAAPKPDEPGSAE